MGPIFGFLASQGVVSAAFYSGEILTACAPTYPEDPHPPTNLLTTVSAQNFIGHYYSSAFYSLASVLTNWQQSAQTGAPVPATGAGSSVQH